MSDGLTREDMALLKAPFRISAHKQKQKKWWYLTEVPITERLDRVDPNWSFVVTDIHRSGKDNQFAVATANLTICGVTRTGVGMQQVEYTSIRDKDGKVTGKTDIETGEPEKGAGGADALRRAYRLFGGGRYLLSMPEGLNEQQFQAWMCNRFPGYDPETGEVKSKNAPAENNQDKKPQSTIDPAWRVMTGQRLVEMVSDKNGKPRAKVGNVMFWTRDPFREAGYDVATWNKAGMKIDLKDAPFTCYAIMNERGFMEGKKIVPEEV